MLPDLEKIILVDSEARSLVTQAKLVAQQELDQAQNRVQAIRDKLQGELAQLRETIQDEILRQANAKAAEVVDSTDRYIAKLREKRDTQGEEIVAFLLSQVLAK